MRELEKIKLGVEYVTRYKNYPVKILCVDAPGEHCVIACAIQSDTSSKIYKLLADGRLNSSQTDPTIIKKKGIPAELYLNFYRNLKGELVVKPFDTAKEAESAENKFVTNKFLGRHFITLTKQPNKEPTKNKRSNAIDTIIKTGKTVQCPKCGSTRRSYYNNIVRELEEGVNLGEPYNQIVYRTTDCLLCGHRRQEKSYEFVEKENGSSRPG